jgi:hypothetical protein
LLPEVSRDKICYYRFTSWILPAISSTQLLVFVRTIFNSVSAPGKHSGQ